VILRTVEYEIGQGRHPPTKQLTHLLRRSEPQTLPPIVLNYLADLIAGEIRRKRGRQKTPWQADNIEGRCLIRRVQRWQRVYERRGYASAQQKAFAKVAEEYGWANSNVAQRNYFRERKKVAPIGNPDWWVKRVIIANGLRGPRNWPPRLQTTQPPRQPPSGLHSRRPPGQAAENTARLVWGALRLTNNRVFCRIALAPSV
jgi:hypothetical protein